MLVAHVVIAAVNHPAEMAPESLNVVRVHRAVILAHELQCSVVADAVGISQSTQTIVGVKFIGEHRRTVLNELTDNRL